jgi:hypothetical protein
VREKLPGGGMEMPRRMVGAGILPTICGSMSALAITRSLT